MVKIISIDVGIKNLAYCCLESTVSGINILDWDIINIMENMNPICCNTYRNKPCSKVASYSIKDKTKINTINTINTVDAINTNDSTIYFCNKKTCIKKMEALYTKKNIKTYKKKTCKNTSIQELCVKLLTKLQQQKHNLLQVDSIIIENQPVLKNPTMKSIQMILYTFFTEHGLMEQSSPISCIKLFSARNKLKTYDGPTIACTLKNKYNKRKFLSIEYTKYFIKQDKKWYDFFLSNTKKDDLADCYMQGIYYITYKK